MRHWSVSRSGEYCSFDNTAIPLPCDGVRSCPGSNGFADFSDTSSLKALILRGIPDAACENEHNPTAFSCAHRKKPASAEHHVGVYTLQEVFSGDPYDNRLVPAEDESPVGRIRRMRSSGHWMRAGLHICESVFFRLKLRIVAFFPCFDPSKLDLFVMQDASKRFNADRRNDFFSDEILSKFFQRPTFKRATQQVWRAFSCFCNKCLVVFSKFIRPARSWFCPQGLKAMFVKIFDNRPNVMFRIVNKLCDSRYFIALIGSQYNLGTANLDTTGTAAKYSLNLLSFTNAEVSCVQTHKKSLSMGNNIELFLRVCLYNTELCIAQVLNSKLLRVKTRSIAASDFVRPTLSDDSIYGFQPIELRRYIKIVNIIFWKRH